MKQLCILILCLLATPVFGYNISKDMKCVELKTDMLGSEFHACENDKIICFIYSSYKEGGISCLVKSDIK